MKAFQIMVAVAATALFLSVSIDAFAMGSRRGKGGFNTEYNNGPSNYNHHHEDSDEEDFSGDVFFDHHDDKHDPFSEGSPHQDGDKHDDQNDDFSFNQDEHEHESGENQQNDCPQDSDDLDELVFRLDASDNPQDTQAVPEPATVGLMLLGGAGMGLLRRKTKA